MDSIHLSKELLDAVATGRIDPDMLQELLFEHLADRCPDCGHALVAWAGWRQIRGTSRGTAGLVQALKLLLGEVPAVAGEVLAAQTQARAELETLRSLPLPERLSQIDRSLSRFRGPELAALCLEEARRSIPAHPRQAWEWAVVAEQTAHRGLGPRSQNRAGTLVAVAVAHQGNALRVLEDLPAAEERFGHAGELVRLGGVTDLCSLAEIHCLEASLHRALRRFAKAEECLKGTILLYRVVGDTSRQTGALVTLGTLYHALGRPEEALATVERAAASLTSDADSRLCLAVHHNRSFYLCDLGRYVDAAETLDGARALYDLFDDSWTRLRLAWLEGKIARGRGEMERAEERLRAAREGFLAEESAYDAALVSLELASLHLDEGRTAAVRRLAQEMVGTFRFLGVRREALAAAALFAEAAERDRVTAELVARLALYLRQSQGSGPVPAFEPRC